jgi:hypothetical protein
MKIIKTKVYEFDELNDQAKEKAREWYRSGALDYEWWESTYEDAERVGLKITGFDLDRNRHATGDFERDAQDVAALILKEHGKDCETFKAATVYLADLAELNAEIEAVDGDDETNVEFWKWQDKRTSLKEEFLHSILEDYSIILQNEMEYQLSDEQVDESIRANKYTFTESGKRCG